MKNVFVFNPDEIIVNGKSFPAVYAIKDSGAVQIVATVQENGNEKPVLIEIGQHETEYMIAYAIACLDGQTAPAPQAAENVPQDAPQVAENVPQDAPQAAEDVPQDAPQAAEDAPQDAPQAAEDVPQDAPQAAEDAPQAAEDVPQDVPPVVDPKATRGPVPEKYFAGVKINGRGWEIVFDKVANRTRVIISPALMDAARPVVESAGFYWSPVMQSFNKKLSFKAYRAAQALADTLAKIA